MDGGRVGEREVSRGGKWLAVLTLSRRGCTEAFDARPSLKPRARNGLATNCPWD